MFSLVAVVVAQVLLVKHQILIMAVMVVLVLHRLFQAHQLLMLAVEGEEHDKVLLEVLVLVAVVLEAQAVLVVLEQQIMAVVAVVVDRLLHLLQGRTVQLEVQA